MRGTVSKKIGRAATLSGVKKRVLKRRFLGAPRPIRPQILLALELEAIDFLEKNQKNETKNNVD